METDLIAIKWICLVEIRKENAIGKVSYCDFYLVAWCKLRHFHKCLLKFLHICIHQQKECWENLVLPVQNNKEADEV